jgi:hypothetical protein
LLATSHDNKHTLPEKINITYNEWDS